MTTGDEKIVSATLDAMRELTIDQLRVERKNIAREVQAAVTVAESMIDYVIAEKLALN